MNDAQRQDIIRISRELHDQIEQCYLANPAGSADPDWPQKQRLLLADMALHLLQTALNPVSLDTDKLKNNLHAILTISDQFLPQAGLKNATSRLYQS